MANIVLLHWDIIQKIFLNTILVSIPEEIYIVMLTLILMGEFDYWKENECKKLINRWDYPRLLIPSIPIALLLNILKYTGFNLDLFSIICMFIFYILIVLTNDVLNDASALKWMGKALICFLISFISVGLIELLYIPFILYGTGKTIEEINISIPLNFLFSLPAKSIQLAIIIFFITNKRMSKINLTKYFLNNKILSLLFITISTFDLFFLLLMYKIIVYEKVFINANHIMQLLIIVGVIILPIVNIFCFIYSIYYIKNAEIKNRQNAYERLSNLSKNVEIYTNNEKYDNIRWKLNELNMAIKQIASDIYTYETKNKGG